MEEGEVYLFEVVMGDGSVKLTYMKYVNGELVPYLEAV